jgi:F-type H+-transporting ATPase subunit epsilon
MKLQIIKLDKVIFQGEVLKIKARSPGGQFEVLKGHGPMIATLTAGEFFCEEGTENNVRPRTFSLAGGIMKVTPKEVVVLAE